MYKNETIVKNFIGFYCLVSLILQKNKKIFDYFYYMTTSEISFYESFYMKRIWGIMSSSRFTKDLKSIEKFVSKNYDYLRITNEKNKIKIGVRD